MAITIRSGVLQNNVHNIPTVVYVGGKQHGKSRPINNLYQLVDTIEDEDYFLLSIKYGGTEFYYYMLNMGDEHKPKIPGQDIKAKPRS